MNVRVKPTALKTMVEHGRSQLENGLEVGGVITGRKDNDSVVVTHAVPLSIGQKTTVEITPELFVEAHKKKEESGIEDPIIGWYHSHPGYSCFMSKLDETAHQKLLNLYKDAIALVLDPEFYGNGKPSSEYFKVFTLSDGGVTEIPSDIDGSRGSKDEMFRGFVSGKETVIERVVIKPPKGRSWAQMASLAFLALILITGLATMWKLDDMESNLSKRSLTSEDTLNEKINSLEEKITTLDQEINLLNARFEVDDTVLNNPLVKGKISTYSHNLEQGRSDYTIRVFITSGKDRKLSIKYTFEELVGDSPDISLKIDNSPTQFQGDTPIQFGSTQLVKLFIKLKNTTQSFTLVITIEDTQSGQQYVLNLNFGQSLAQESGG